MNRMTQYLTQIEVLGWSLVHRETMYTDARRCVCICGTPLGSFSAGRISFALIGRRSSGGGSVGCADWSRVDGVVDISPGGFWIDFIRPGLENGQSIVAAPVTGSLVSSTLFGCRDVICTAGSTLNWTFCGMDLGLAGWISGVATEDHRALDHGCKQFLVGGQSCGYHAWG